MSENSAIVIIWHLQCSKSVVTLQGGQPRIFLLLQPGLSLVLKVQKTSRLEPELTRLSTQLLICLLMNNSNQSHCNIFCVDTLACLPVMTEHNIKLMTKLITKSRLTKLVGAQKPQSINKHNKTSAGGDRALICTLFCRLGLEGPG